MVRLQQCVRKTLSFFLVGMACHAATAIAQKYLPDDPISKVPEVGSAHNAKVQSINAFYDFLHHSVKYKTPPEMPSLGINTVDEVPDSSWFTNRTTLTTEALKKGARIHGDPQPPFTVVAAKTEGVTPGFRIKDGRGLIYFVKVDPPQNIEMGSAADVMGALFLYAAGYNVPENYILFTRRRDLHLSENATITASSGKKYPLTKAQFEKILDQVPVTSNGQVRLMASLSMSGRVIGPFRYEFTRGDDPNDLIPHDRRRDLRGLAVLFAWLNHTDAKGENSLDSVVGKEADARIVHHLLDFNDSFGSDSDIAKDPRHGQEFWLPTSREQVNRALTLGLAPASWEKARYPHQLPAVGNFTATGFDPLTWKPNYPNPAFLEMTPQDAYWGAKRVMAFSNEDIRAVVEEGQFSDPRATDYITNVLIERRNLIGKAWFSRVAPLEDFAIVEGRLHYTDLGKKYGVLPAEDYTYSWFSFDDVSGSAGAPMEGSTNAVPSSLADGDFIGCKITNTKEQRRSVTVIFRKQDSDWRPVGIARTSL